MEHIDFCITPAKISSGSHCSTNLWQDGVNLQVMYLSEHDGCAAEGG